MDKGKKLKINLKVVIILILICILISLIGILLNKQISILITNSQNEKINFNKIYELKPSDNFSIFIQSTDEFYFDEIGNLIYYDNNVVQLSINEVRYNFENYHTDYYGNKYIEDITSLEKILNEKLNSIDTEIYHIDCIYKDEDPAETVNGFYFVKTDELLLVMNAFYENQKLYSEYQEIITHMVTNMQITNGNDMSEYMQIVNDDSSLDLSYNELSESEKEKYNEMHRTLFQENKTIILEEYSEDYHVAAKALENDALHYNLEHYNIYMTMKLGEDQEYNFLDWEKEQILEEFNNSESQNKYIEIEAVYEKNIINLIYDKNIYGTEMENVEITDEEIEILNNNVNKVINNMPSNLSNYGKYKYLAESVCELTQYAYEELENGTSDRIYSILGVFVDGRAVCEGYAKAYSYLCKKIGLYCENISGYPFEDEPGHIFNYIKLEDKYYFVDTTWMDDQGDCQFAFIYDENIPNEHNSYIQWVYQNGYPRIETILQDLKDNLGDKNWYELQKIF